MIPERVRVALMIEIHSAIAVSTSRLMSVLGNVDAEPEVHYPPNAELSIYEREALRSLKLNPFASSAIEKLVRGAMSYPTFHLLSLLDGVADLPQVIDGDSVYDGVWKGLSLVEREAGSQPMLHDEFYQTFWDFDRSQSGTDNGTRASNKDKGPRLNSHVVS